MSLPSYQEAMGAAGGVVLVRFVDNRVWFTFGDSHSALRAVQRSPLQVTVKRR